MAAALGLGLVLWGMATPPAEAAGESARATAAAVCEVSCCPSLVVSETGRWSLDIGRGSVFIILGSVVLALGHLCNLRACALVACREQRCAGDVS